MIPDKPFGRAARRGRLALPAVECADQASRMDASHERSARELPQSGHLVSSKLVEQCGQTAPVAKVSKACWQWLHCQYSPRGGAVWQTGQAYSGRRGNCSIWRRPRACRKLSHQFDRRKAAMIPIQSDCHHTANPMSAAPPMKPITVAAIRLRALPSGYHSSDRRICPPSSG